MEILNDENPEFSSGSLLHYAQGFAKAFELQRLPFYSSSRGGGGSIGDGGSHGSDSVRAPRAMAGARAVAVVDGVDYSMVEQKRTVARRLLIGGRPVRLEFESGVVVPDAGSSPLCVLWVRRYLVFRTT